MEETTSYWAAVVGMCTTGGGKNEREEGTHRKNELEVAGVQEPGSSLAAPLLIVRRSSGGTPEKEGRRREVQKAITGDGIR